MAAEDQAEDRPADLQSLADRQTEGRSLERLAGPPGRQMRVAAEERDRGTKRSGGAVAPIASCGKAHRPDRRDNGEGSAGIARGDSDQPMAEAATRFDRGIGSEHGADAECIDRAHRMELSIRYHHPMLARPVGQRVRTNDFVILENDQIAGGEALQQQPHLVRPGVRAVRDLLRRGCPPKTPVELQDRMAHAIPRRCVPLPGSSFPTRLEHRHQSAVGRCRGDYRPVGKGHAWAQAARQAVVGPGYLKNSRRGGIARRLHHSATRDGNPTPAVASVSLATPVSASSKVTTAAFSAIETSTEVTPGTPASVFFTM